MIGKAQGPPISITGLGVHVPDRVLTNDGRAAYLLATGTRVGVDAHADVDLGVTSTTQQFTVHAGSVHADWGVSRVPGVPRARGQR